jgi:hypothetical protein
MDEELKKALELISKSKDVEEVQQELVKLVPGVQPKDAFSILEKSDEGKILLNSFADKRVTEGVNTAIEKFKKKDMPEFITKAVKEKETELTKKFKPELSEEAKRLIEHEKEIEELKRENKLAQSEAKITSLFAKEKVNTSFIPYFVGEDLDSSINKATEFIKEFQQAVSMDSEAVVKEKFKELKFDPDKKDDKDSGGVVSEKDVETAREKARELGTNEARAEYSMLKKKYEHEKSQEQQ